MYIYIFTHTHTILIVGGISLPPIYFDQVPAGSLRLLRMSRGASFQGCGDSSWYSGEEFAMGNGHWFIHLEVVYPFYIAVYAVYDPYIYIFTIHLQLWFTDLKKKSIAMTIC